MATSGSTDDLNLVPYLDIVTTLMVCFLVVGSVAAEGLAVVEAEVDVPTDGVGRGHTPLVAVHVERAGFRVQGDGGSLLLAAGPDGALPFAELSRTLRTIHDHGGSGARATLSAEADTPLVHVVHTMDAMREDDAGELYPSVSLARPLGG